MENPHEITLNEAVTMTHAYQSSAQFQGLTLACLMDKQAYELLCNQPGCTSIRTYFALNSTGQLCTVTVGVDDSNVDMTDGLIMNRTQGCPAKCDPNSALME
jgi:hypothetical protein